MKIFSAIVLSFFTLNVQALTIECEMSPGVVHQIEFDYKKVIKQERYKFEPGALITIFNKDGNILETYKTDIMHYLKRCPGCHVFYVNQLPSRYEGTPSAAYQLGVSSYEHDDPTRPPYSIESYFSTDPSRYLKDIKCDVIDYLL